MNKADKKQKILALLQLHANWMGLAIVLNNLGDAFKNRTVRRLLAELRDDGLVIRKGRGPSTKHKIASTNVVNQGSNIVAENQKNTYSSNRVFSKKTLVIINTIRRPIFQRIPVSYNKPWFDSYIANETFYFSQQQREEMAVLGNRNKNHEILPAGTYSRKILNRLLIDLSYNSSRLEGNTYSKLDTEKLLVQGLHQDEKLDAERVMILNHKDAIEYLVCNAQSLTICYQTICTLHYLLADGLLLIAHMGKVRNEAVRIGQSTYLPLEDKLRLEANLYNILAKAVQIIDPFEQSLFLLIQIAYLQPFMDVNKRTSRLSANITLIKENYVPLSFNELNKDDYITAMLAVYELNQVTPMADLYYFSYLRTCQAYDATVESVGFDPIRVKYRQQRRGVITNIIRYKMSATEALEFIQKQSLSNGLAIDKNDREKFIESITQELEQLSINTISGLGITQNEFEQWKFM